MATVETVTGAIDASELGQTLVHEHLVYRDEAILAQWPDFGSTALEVEDGRTTARSVSSEEAFEVAVAAASAALDRGVRTVCEPTAMLGGRDVRFSRAVAERTGLQLVACTGIYTYEHLPQAFALRDAVAIADLFVADIEQGIQGTEIKAAFLKCAADEPGVTENIEKVHRAVARASVRTGAPIMAHSRPASQTGLRQIEIFEEEGANLNRVQIAHTGDTDDLDYIERLLGKGVYIGMDRYGLNVLLPFERRNATVSELLERGYAERMFLSADSCATLDWAPPEVADQMAAAGLIDGWHISIVHDRVIPALREAGMTDEQLETMMVDNPRRWLAG